jgi:hypothetical protein
MKDMLSVLAVEVPPDEQPIPVDTAVPGGGFLLELGEIGKATMA